MSNTHSGCGAESLTTHTTSYQASEVCSQCYDLNDFEFIEYILNNDKKIVDDLQEQMNKSSKRIQELEKQLELEHKQQEKLEEKIEKYSAFRVNLMSKACLENRLDILQQLKNKGVLNTTYNPKLLDDCIENDTVDCLKFVRNNSKFYNNYTLEPNSYDENDTFVNIRYQIEKAIKSHSNKCLEYLCEELTFRLTTDNERIFEENADDDEDQYYVFSYNRYTRLAAEYGNIIAYKILYNKGCTLVDEELLNLAAESGNLQCLQTLFELGQRFNKIINTVDGISRVEIGIAAIKLTIKKNNLNCLQYLIETVHCGEQNQLDFVNSSIIKLPNYILEYTVQCSSWDCMKYFIEKCPINGVFWTDKCGQILCGENNYCRLNKNNYPLDIVIYAYENGCPFNLKALGCAFLEGFVDVLEFLNNNIMIDLYDLLQEAIKICAYQRSQTKDFIHSFSWLAKKVYGPWNKSLLTPIIFGIVKNDLLDDVFCRWLAFDADKRFWIHSIGEQYIEKIKIKQNEIEVLKNESKILYKELNIPKAVIKYDLFSYF